MFDTKNSRNCLDLSKDNCSQDYFSAHCTDKSLSSPIIRFDSPAVSVYDVIRLFMILLGDGARNDIHMVQNVQPSDDQKRAK